MISQQSYIVSTDWDSFYLSILGEDSIDEGITYPVGHSQYSRTKNSNEFFVNGDGDVFKVNSPIIFIK